jgi:TolB-like protein/DNA-binding winged helix-turn-helix (wHTH) protein
MSDQARIWIGDWLVTPGRNLLERAGQSTRIEPRAMDVLVHLARNPEQVVSVDDLVTAVWQGAVVTDHSVYLAISQLRQAFGDGHIETIRKRGYRLIVPVVPFEQGDRRPGRAVDKQPGRRSPIAAWSGAALAAILIGVAVLSLLDKQDGALPPGPPRLAVLPCENLSPDPGDAYFAAGIHEEILNRLAQIGGLNVIARTSVLPYANAGLSIRQIASDLDVSAVMECSVRYSGDKILVTGQLIDPETDSHLWSNSYQRDRDAVSGLFAMQADIATNIARALHAKLTPSEERRVGRASTDSMEAYIQILKLFEAYRRYGPPEALFAYVDAAIMADPDYAFAYAARGSLHLASANAASILRGASEARDPGLVEVERQHRLELANDDALRALKIDPQLGIAYSILGALSFLEGDRGLARQHFERSLELGPGDPLVLRQYAVFEAVGNHLSRALELMERARQVDPGFAEPIMYAIAGEYDLARQFAQDEIGRNPLNPSGHLAIALLDATIFNDAGSAERALRLVEELAGEDAAFFHQTTQLLVAYVYGRLGLTSDARRVYDDVLAALPNEQALTPAARMRAHLALHEVDEAYEWAVKMVESPQSSGQPAPLIFMRNPFNEPVFEQPEFVELRRRLGYSD